MTLDREASAELERPIESRDDLVAYMRAGEKDADCWRVGVEHEKIAVRRDDGRPVDYGGSDGVEALLRHIAVEDPRWEPVYEDGHVVALDGPDGGITLEPGGQVELNGRPYRSMRDNCAEFHRHLDFLRKVAEPFDIVWLGTGIHPSEEVDALPRVPRTRYRIMREYLPTRGDLALHMMHATASVQVSFDFSDERDMVDKMRTGVAATPIAAALFANSPIAAGEPNGFVSRRMEIWRRTDPDRCGLLPIVWEPAFGYERYVEWALDVPMFFIVRGGGYEAMHGKPFREFWRSGHRGEAATLADWERHLTTLFPEVRVKRILEVRCADAVPHELLCAIPALWKGLLYDAEAAGAARELCAGWSPADRDAVFAAVARAGLAADTPSGPVRDLAAELVSLARAGLARFGDAQGLGDETVFLDPLDDVLARGQSPGEEALERWRGEWQGSLSRFLESARY